MTGTADRRGRCRVAWSRTALRAAVRRRVTGSPAPRSRARLTTPRAVTNERLGHAGSAAGREHRGAVRAGVDRPSPRSGVPDAARGVPAERGPGVAADGDRRRQVRGLPAGREQGPMTMEFVDAGVGSIEGGQRLLDRLARGWMGSAERVKAVEAYRSMTGCSAARATEFADQ